MTPCRYVFIPGVHDLWEATKLSLLKEPPRSKGGRPRISGQQAVQSSAWPIRGIQGTAGARSLSCGYDARSAGHDWKGAAKAAIARGMRPWTKAARR